MPNGPRQAGEFCWFNILSPRPDAAREYFADVLGWTYAEIPGAGGHVVMAGGTDIGAIFGVARAGGGADHAPIVGVMLLVPDADAAAARVTALGGRAAAPFDIGPRLRMAVCHDPGGAEFDVMEPRASAGTTAGPAQPGAPGWHECFAPDVERVSAFYAALFGWAPRTVPSGIGPYMVFHRGDVAVAGLASLAATPPGTPANWQTYFNVADVDRALSRTLAAGGQVTVAAREMPGGGRIGGLVSPQGVAFRVVQPAP